MKTMQKTVYKYSELSDSAKEKALQCFCNGLHPEEYDFVTDDFKEILELIGFTDIDTQFSGFWSQGDGASFSACYSYNKGSAAKVKDFAPRDSVLHDIAQSIAAIQRRAFYGLVERIEKRGRYCHEYSMTCENSDLLEQFQRLARWHYSALKKGYEYATSAESFAESASANDWHFDSEGVFAC
jgi:hypothetical protein